MATALSELRTSRSGAVSYTHLDVYKRQLLSGKVYFELAIFSGPLFGAFGAWWRQQLSMVPVIMVGMLFLVEALAHASQTSALVQYADQVAGIEVLVGALWTVLALNKTKVLRHDVGADRAP